MSTLKFQISTFILLIISLTAAAKDRISDFTVIFCGMPERVEQYTAEDYAEILRLRESGEIGSNVCFAGLLKFGEGKDSLSWQKELAPYGYDGTQYIDLGMKNNHDILPIKDDTLNATVSYFKEFNARRYADKYYQFFNTDSLANLIRSVSSSHPAKRYVLILQGHGNGQYCMRDDYYPNRRGLTAEELKTAIEKSGVKLYTILFHNCLMGTLENLAVYKHCARYALLSPNETCGGYMAQFIANLSKAGDNTDNIAQQLRKTVDFYAKTADRDDEIDTSLGVYDLSKMKKLLRTVKKISVWYSDAMSTDSALIDSAMITTVTADNDSLTEKGADISEVREHRRLILSHFIQRTITILSSSSEKSHDYPTKSRIRRLKGLYEKYMSQLRSIAYIKRNHQNDSTEEDNYLYASPSVTFNSIYIK